MRLLICAGGTGGGVYPALAVLGALRAEDEQDLEVMWVGGAGGMEAELVSRAGIRFESIPAAGVHGVGWRNLPGNLHELGRGYLAARRVLHRFRPQVLLFTGGFVAVPMALAARILSPTGKRAKILLYVPDIEPGLALKALAFFADQIAVTAAEARQYFGRSARIQVTGYPVRDELRTAVQAGSQSEARKELGLEPGLPTLLVFGGSKGARSLNQALLPQLQQLLPEMQVIHITGQLDWSQVDETRQNLEVELPVGQAKRYHAYPYLHAEMAAALQAADLVVSRAGAATLGEYPALGLPAILVPYPYAWRYQRVNADYLADQGAAVVIEDRDLSRQLLPEVRRLMRNDTIRQQMSTRMRTLDQPEAAGRLGGLLRELAIKARGGQ